MNDILIVNKRQIAPQARDVYVGRPAILGNPFSINGKQTRELVIANYKKWLKWKISVRDTEVMAEVIRLVDMANDGSGLPIRLVCWCAPLPCHAAVIRSLLVHLCGTKEQP